MAKNKRDRNLGNGTQNKSRRPQNRCISNNYGFICKILINVVIIFNSGLRVYSSYFHKYVPKSRETFTELSVLDIK